MKSEIYAKSRRHNIVIQELNDEILVYKLTENKALCLNKTSAVVWSLADGSKSVSQIAQEASRKLNSSVNQELVWLALDQLIKEDLIENDVEFPADFAKLSRREVIKKAGLATMIALPVISTLIAPTAIQAGSCLQAGASCTTSARCCSTNTTTVTPTTGPNAGIPSAPITGSCCRSSGTPGMTPYGPVNTCVPGPSSGITVPQGNISYNGGFTNGGSVSCFQ